MSEPSICKCGHPAHWHTQFMPKNGCRWDRECPCTDYDPDSTEPPPRVARSVDDLRVGMVVVWKAKGGSWTMPRNPLRDGNDVWERAECVVILADPPAPPAADWLVPADAMAELRAELENHYAEWGTKGDRGSPIRLAWAVLDAATEVEP